MSMLLAPAAWAGTYYVAATGNDAPGCGSPSTPCRHLSYAARQMASGDTMAILPGTYEDYLYTERNLDFTDNWGPGLPSGTASQPTVVKAADGYGTVTIRPESSRRGGISLSGVSYIVLDGLILDGWGIGLGSAYGILAEHITIQNSEIKNDPSQGIAGHAEYLSVLNCKIHHNGSDPSQIQGYTPELLHGIYVAGSNSRFIGNDIYSNTGEGITLHDSLYKIRQDNNLIANNNVHDNGGGIQFTNGANVRIDNNLLWGGSGMQIETSATKVYHNTLAGSGSLYVGPYASTADVRNNLLAGTGGISDEYGHIASQSNNLLNADSQVVNPISSGGSSCKGATCSDRTPPTPPDLHLKSTASLAIDNGVSLPDVPTDFEGVSRPQGSGYDIGAYEYRTTPLLPGDLNQDGKRDLADVRLLIYMLLGQQAKTPEADLTGDGAVTLADVQALIRLMVGL